MKTVLYARRGSQKPTEEQIAFVRALACAAEARDWAADTAAFADSQRVTPSKIEEFEKAAAPFDHSLDSL